MESRQKIPMEIKKIFKFFDEYGLHLSFTSILIGFGIWIIYSIIQQEKIFKAYQNLDSSLLPNMNSVENFVLIIMVIFFIIPILLYLSSRIYSYCKKIYNNTETKQ